MVVSTDGVDHADDGLVKGAELCHALTIARSCGTFVCGKAFGFAVSQRGNDDQERSWWVAVSIEE
jgi:hypothetical protein